MLIKGFCETDEPHCFVFCYICHMLFAAASSRGRAPLSGSHKHPSHTLKVNYTPI